MVKWQRQASSSSGRSGWTAALFGEAHAGMKWAERSGGDHAIYDCDSTRGAIGRDRPDPIQRPLSCAALADDGAGDQLCDTIIMRDAGRLFATATNGGERHLGRSGFVLRNSQDQRASHDRPLNEIASDATTTVNGWVLNKIIASCS